MTVPVVDVSVSSSGAAALTWTDSADSADFHHAVDRQRRADAQFHVLAEKLLKPGAVILTR